MDECAMEVLHGGYNRRVCHVRNVMLLAEGLNNWGYARKVLVTHRREEVMLDLEVHRAERHRPDAAEDGVVEEKVSRVADLALGNVRAGVVLVEAG